MDETERARLQQIATDAQVGHWPSHLGLNTDAERINYLAQTLEKTIDGMSDHEAIEELKDELKDDIESVEDKVSLVETDIESIKERLEKLEEEQQP